MNNIKTLITFSVVIFFLVSPAYAEIVEIGNRTYEVSIDKTQKEISIVEIKKDEGVEGVDNVDSQKSETVSFQNPKRPVVTTDVNITDEDQSEQLKENQKAFFVAEGDDHHRKTTSLKSQRLEQFKEYFAAKTDLVAEKKADYKDLLPIEAFSNEIKELLDQVRTNERYLRETKLTPLDQKKAQAIASVLTSRIENIQNLMGFGLESDDKYNETKNSFTNVEDLARIAETVEILDFAEKAIQAMGGF